MEMEPLLKKDVSDDKAYSVYKNYVKIDTGRGPYVLKVKAIYEITKIDHGYRFRIKEDHRPIYFFETYNPFWKGEYQAILDYPKIAWSIRFLPLGAQKYRDSEYLFALRITPTSAIIELDHILQYRREVSYKFLEKLQKEIHALGKC